MGNDTSIFAICSPMEMNWTDYSGGLRGNPKATAASNPAIQSFRTSGVGVHVGVPKERTDSRVGDAGSPFTGIAALSTTVFQVPSRCRHSCRSGNSCGSGGGHSAKERSKPCHRPVNCS
jgi:hypothetical protein